MINSGPLSARRGAARGKLAAAAKTPRTAASEERAENRQQRPLEREPEPRAARDLAGERPARGLQRGPSRAERPAARTAPIAATPSDPPTVRKNGTRLVATPRCAAARPPGRRGAARAPSAQAAPDDCARRADPRRRGVERRGREQAREPTTSRPRADDGRPPETDSEDEPAARRRRDRPEQDERRDDRAGRSRGPAARALHEERDVRLDAVERDSQEHGRHVWPAVARRRTSAPEAARRPRRGGRAAGRPDHRVATIHLRRGGQAGGSGGRSSASRSGTVRNAPASGPDEARDAPDRAEERPGSSRVPPSSRGRPRP